MAFELPDTKTLQNIAKNLNWDLADERAAELEGFLATIGGAYQWLDNQSDGLPVSSYQNRSYEYPKADENPHNAWFVTQGPWASPRGHGLIGITPGCRFIILRIYMVMQAAISKIFQCKMNILKMRPQGHEK